MAMNVSFKKGLKASLPSTRDANTFYYVSDEFALYLGEHLISNEVTAAQFNNLKDVVIPALEGRVKTLEDWKAALTELSKDNGANDLVKVTVTTEAGAVKAVAVDDAALDQKLADDLAAAKKYTDDAVEGIVSGSGYATQTWVTGEIQKLDAEVNSGDNDLVKVSVTEVDGVVTAVAVDDAKLDAKIAEYRTSAAQDLIDAAQDKALTDYKAEMVTAMSNADTAAQGYASAAESAAKGYADQKLLDFENAYIKADDNNTIDKLNEIAAWISDDEAGATKIISDVATNAANIKTINESAVMTSGINATKVSEYDATKKTVDDNKATWDKAGTALQASDIANVAWQNESNNFSQKQYFISDDSSLVGTGFEGTMINKTGMGVSFSPTSYTIYGANSIVHADAFGPHTFTLPNIDEADVNATIAIRADIEAVQGATTNTVKDCVDAINSMNNQTGEVIGTVENIVSQLTWGSF